jgi:Na+:H+ antiporter, NhaA family
MKEKPVDIWIIRPIGKFISNSTASGMVLFAAAFLAMVISNSFLAHAFHELWEIKFSIGFGNFVISKSLHHWINDGLMSLFFFVVGLELKREIVAGELSSPKDAILPVVAGLGGMLIPALIYWLINSGADTQRLNGWGIPMATDIAFALGVLYLLGNRVPLSLKVFLTALAIIDDLGAVLIIAFFYTSDISFINLGIGAGFMAVMIFANLIGVRSAVFYGIVGIGGLWTAFLLSGIHATIAAVLAAFTIPASVKITESDYVLKMKRLVDKFASSPANNLTIVTPEQQKILDEIKYTTSSALTPLQKLEHSLHPLVAFIVMPVFALANAGVSLSGDILENLTSKVALGVGLGLIIGKVAGILGSVYLAVKLRITKLPKDVTFLHMTGVAFLAGIGFTMSLFITSLAFTDELYILQAKIGILSASLIAGITGYVILRNLNKK